MDSLQAQALVKVIATLDELGIRYVVGGSFASSFYGEARITHDIDIVVAITLQHLPGLVEKLQDDFYINEESVRRAIRSGKTFNAIHFDSSFKVDFFVARGVGLQEKELERRQLKTLQTEPPVTFYATTAEDIMLAKLDWYQKGGCVSEQQWRDISGVIRVQAERLDYDYLREWAAKLEVSDLLEQALEESLNE